MELSKRLCAVAGLVTEGASVADIGTDHGYIPIYLVGQQISPKVIAMDINSGPLARAKLHIQGQTAVKDRIETRQSDGLSRLMPGEVKEVIAAGMGGGLIIHILEQGRAVTEVLESLILQPQSEIYKVRQYLNEHGFYIAAEDMVEEDGKYYPMMKAVHGEKETYFAMEYQYGKRLLAQCHPVLKKYLLREEHIRMDILDRLRASKSPAANLREGELTEELKQIHNALACYGENG